MKSRKGLWVLFVSDLYTSATESLTPWEMSLMPDIPRLYTLVWFTEITGRWL